VWRCARQPTHSAPANGTDTAEQSGGSNGELDARAKEAVQAAEAHWSSIMKTLGDPQARLRELAGAAQGTAAALRRGSGAGFERSHPAREIPANWQPPLELRQGAPRPGPLASWQALDRAFKALVAALNDPTVSLPDLAAAWDALAGAAVSLADAIDNASAQERAVCSFCTKSAREVRKLITGPPGLGICNECVELCVEVLEEDS